MEKQLQIESINIHQKDITFVDQVGQMLIQSVVYGVQVEKQLIAQVE